MEVFFILVNPKNEGNIGASARALNTMGFSSLRLVTKRTNLGPQEASFAHGSGQILDQAQIFDSTSAAVADLDFLVGTTARRRNFQYDYVSSRQLPEFLSDKAQDISKVGILFGTEPEGLSNDDLALCDVASSIPMYRSQPSLNLAQAVMLYAYELASGCNLQPEGERRQAISPGATSYLRLKEAAASFLEEVGVRGDTVLFKKAMEKIALFNSKDLELAYFIYGKIAEHIRQLKERRNND